MTEKRVMFNFRIIETPERENRGKEVIKDKFKKFLNERSHQVASIMGENRHIL